MKTADACCYDCKVSPKPTHEDAVTITPFICHTIALDSWTTSTTPSLAGNNPSSNQAVSATRIMFRRFAQSISNAVSNVTTTSNSQTTAPSEDARVAQLCSMGFRDGEARHALRVTQGDMHQAAEWLLANGTQVSSGVATATSTTSTGTGRPAQSPSSGDGHDDDDDMQRAIQASLEDRASGNRGDKADQHPHRSEAGRQSGRAVEKTNNVVKTSPRTPSTNDTTDHSNHSMNGSTPIASHPKVQVPKRLSQHDKEDVILRCAARIAPHPVAVDTLIKSLRTIQANPHEKRYQTVDTTTAAFQRSLNAPGVLDFLRAMNFFPTPGGNGSNGAKVLQLAHLDRATFYLGLSALEQVQQTNEEYAYNKAMLLFDRELERQLALADTDMEEALKRSEYMRRCPSEPTGVASQIVVELGTIGSGGGGTSSRKVVSRKFEGDDTLADVVHWLGSHASVIPEKLLLFGQDDVADSDRWYLVDRNHSESAPYNVPDLMNTTLQYIGCWPSGRLAVVPVLKESTVGGRRKAPSSRGLGAGPVMDH